MKKKVYLFEDEAALREGMVDELKYLGFEVLGFESVKSFTELHPLSVLKNQVLITDQTMPDSPKGSEFIRETKQALSNESPFCILLSGFLRESGASDEEGAPDFSMEKPVDFDRLEKLLRDA